MKITAVIAEYNPFHYGHKYQLDEIKKTADAVVVIMSGPFVQRGEVAITDKWTRAKAALLSGADLVLELPVIYALNTAQKFAFGAVDILNKMNVVDELCFGSECGDVHILTQAAEILENEPDEISEKIKQLVSSGVSYPSAREKAYEGAINDGVLSTPNNILAVEYIRALKRLDSSIKPVTLKRIGAGYHDTQTKDIASASGIREAISQNKDISKLMPYPEFDIYTTEALDTALTAKLRLMTAEELSCINGVSEGLENRILAAAMVNSTIDDIANAIKTKRYTMTRIKRILMSVLLDMTYELCESRVGYIRVLGMTSVGSEILRSVKRNSELDIITKVADCKMNDIFKADIKAQNIFTLCGNKKNGNIDFITSPVIIK